MKAEAPKRFPRVLDYGGRPIRVLSPHGQATLEADRTAFAELMKHIKEIDGNDHTVILVQVENESGILGSPRDYSPENTKLFNGPVPENLAIRATSYVLLHRADVGGKPKRSKRPCSAS